MTQTCPMCGHDVKVVGDTTQHYEPVGCLQLVDDHQLCEQEAEKLRELLHRIVGSAYGETSYPSSGGRPRRVRTEVDADAVNEAGELLGYTRRIGVD